MYRKKHEWNQQCATILASLIAHHGRPEDGIAQLVEEAADIADSIEFSRRMGNASYEKWDKVFKEADRRDAAKREKNL